MATLPQGSWKRFEDLVFSDLQRYRPAEASWLRVAMRCLTLPGMLASVILRAQQCLFERGQIGPANVLRTVGNVLCGCDLVPGMTVGRGLLLAHPNGVTIGNRLTIGNEVSFAGGVTCAARYPDPEYQDQEFATICDGAVIGAHAVLVGPVRIGRNAMVGSNTVVLTDVPDNAVVFGIPARKVGTRDERGAEAPDAPSAPAAGDTPG